MKRSLLTLIIISVSLMGCVANYPQPIVDSGTAQQELPSNESNLTVSPPPPPPPPLIEPKSGLAIYLKNFQGKAILITEGDNSMLIDAGMEADSQELLRMIRDVGVSTLDYLILSHNTPETLGGLPFIILKTKPTNFLESGLKSETQSYTLAKNLFKNSTKVEHDMAIDFGLVSTQVITPYSRGSGFGQTPSENSLVVRLSYRGTSILLLNGCDFACEEEIMSDDLKSDILFVSGDCKAESLVFLQKVNPSKVITPVPLCNELQQRFANLDIPIIDGSSQNVVVVVNEATEILTG